MRDVARELETRSTWRAHVDLNPRPQQLPTSRCCERSLDEADDRQSDAPRQRRPTPPCRSTRPSRGAADLRSRARDRRSGWHGTGRTPPRGSSPATTMRRTRGRSISPVSPVSSSSSRSARHRTDPRRSSSLPPGSVHCPTAAYPGAIRTSRIWASFVDDRGHTQRRGYSGRACVASVTAPAACAMKRGSSACDRARLVSQHVGQLVAQRGARVEPAQRVVEHAWVGGNAWRTSENTFLLRNRERTRRS